MSLATQWMLLVFGLLALAQTGLSLRCWDCSSHTNSMCGDPMNATEHQYTFSIKECPMSPYQNQKPVCRKLVKREFGERIVVRSCSIPNVDELDESDGTCKPVPSSSRITLESCHICNTDLCNSATGISPTRVLFGGALLLAATRLFSAKLGTV